jgi:hypothetical protein
VRWESYGGRFAPALVVRTICTFNASYGGELGDGGGWAFGSGGSPRELDPSIEFWSEPERGPEGFLPEIPGKPDWTPPDPKVVEAERKKSATEAAKREKEEVDERAQKIADAKATGETLYQCESCDELYNEDDLVQVRSCPHCDDEPFNGSEDGRNCPTCNRTFTKNVSEKGCPECLEECEPIGEA